MADPQTINITNLKILTLNMNSLISNAHTIATKYQSTHCATK